MRASLRDEDVRARFLAHYRQHGVIAQAAREIDVTIAAVDSYRKRHPEFAAEIAPHSLRPRPPRSIFRRVAGARRTAFFDVLAQTGNASAAARAAGLGYGAVCKLRRSNDRFAADWAAAKGEALGRVEDALFDGALNGFTHIETRDGVERVTGRAARRRCSSCSNAAKASRDRASAP